MFKLPEKGTKDYFDKKKKINLIVTIFSFVVVAVIYFTGILIYHHNKSIYTVIAAVAVVPAAKAFVSFFILAPYRSVDGSQRRAIETALSGMENQQILYDILLAESKKPLAAGMVILIDGRVFAYYEGAKESAETEKYLKNILKECQCRSVKMYTEFEPFKKQIVSVAAEEKQRWETLEEKEKIGRNKIRSGIKDQLLIYAI